MRWRTGPDDDATKCTPPPLMREDIYKSKGKDNRYRIGISYSTIRNATGP
jgi:hypothetical protein